MTYAIISVGGKQYRVQEGEKLLVDRLATEEGKTLNPDVLLFGDDGKTEYAPKGVTVTARVVGHVKGEKIRIGKYRRRTGYRRHNGHRSKLTQIEIESIGAGARRGKKAAAAESAPAAPAESGLPAGYADLTVAQVKESAAGWDEAALAAALEYEQSHAKRKGALAALESAIKEGEQ
jgi:large subunit ribosomal protein L21